MLEFTELKLSEALEKNILALGYKSPTPIQEQAIPYIISGQDLAGLAQTGTGKTAAFLIPLIDRLIHSELSAEKQSELSEELKKRVFPDWKPNQFFLVLVPTRELADQILENFKSLTVGLPYKAVAIYGGTGYDKQKQALSNGVQFIFSTPGRLIDLYKEHQIDLKQVRAIIFDEADRMFDMGFKDDMKYILQRVPNDRQFLVFSATLNLEVLNTAYQVGANPVEINISRDKASAENVKDWLFHVGENEKPQHLISMLKKYSPRQTIIFTNFKNNVERIAEFLSKNDLPAIAISSLMTQAHRTKVLSQFRESNELNILVATDIAARGLDIQGVDLVINYELPNDSETYVHRIGRTGRANAIGTALSMCSDRDVDSLTRIEDYLKRKIENNYLENNELVTDFKPIQDFRSYNKVDNHKYSNGKDHQRSNGRPSKFRDHGARGDHSHKNKPHDGQGQAKHHNSQRSERSSVSKSHTASSHQAKTNTSAKQPSFQKQKPFNKNSQLKNKSQVINKKEFDKNHSKPFVKTKLQKNTGIKQTVLGFFKKLVGK